MLEQIPARVRTTLYKLFKVSNFEELVKAVLKILFTLAFLVPMILLPLYFFFFTFLRG